MTKEEKQREKGELGNTLHTGPLRRSVVCAECVNARIDPDWSGMERKFRDNKMSIVCFAPRQYFFDELAKCNSVFNWNILLWNVGCCWAAARLSVEEQYLIDISSIMQFSRVTLPAASVQSCFESGQVPGRYPLIRGEGSGSAALFLLARGISNFKCDKRNFFFSNETHQANIPDERQREGSFRIARDKFIVAINSNDDETTERYQNQV